jgi:AcrR family transcriptional regulator
MKMPRINAEYRDDAKKKIIAAALGLATENGWDAVTLDAIAQNVGVTKPALYSYFDNIDALLREVNLEVARNIQDGLEKTLVHDDNIPRIIRNLAELLFEQQKPYANIIFQLPTRLRQDPKNREEFTHLFNNSRIIIYDCLTRVKSQGELSQEVDPDVATCSIIAMTMGLQTNSEFLEMDVDTAKKIWIAAVERFLLIGHGAGGMR